MLADTAYIERVKRHYAMFRKKIDSKVKTTGPRKRKKKRRKQKRKA